MVYLRERLKEQIERWGDPWKYGIQANKATIDTFMKSARIPRSVNGDEWRF